MTGKTGSTASGSGAAQAGGDFAGGFGEAARALAQLSVPMQKLAEVQGDYLRQATELWNRSLERLPGGTDGAGPAAPIADKRFKAQEWVAHPGAAFLAEMYLLNARTLMQMADQVEADAKTKQRIRFAVQQWIDAASPSNYLALNPEAETAAGLAWRWLLSSTYGVMAA